MSILNNSIANDALTIALDGRVDSKNVKQVEADINKCVSVKPAGPIILDCQKLDLISSAGLRMILRLKQAIADTKLPYSDEESSELVSWLLNQILKAIAVPRETRPPTRAIPAVTLALALILLTKPYRAPQIILIAPPAISRIGKAIGKPSSPVKDCVWPPALV